ncbi:MAG: HEAT repeat domain-containing protein [Treponema sp.]|nr:HEAT repeat domain-containing protein [Treponema sp.]
MKKFIISFVFCTFSFTAVFAQSKIQKFVKGNIQDKISSVKESSGEDAVFLSEAALDFVLESQKLIGNDRDFDGLAVAAILSFPQDFFEASTEIRKNEIIKKFVSLYDIFYTAPNVQIAVLSKINSLSAIVDVSPLVKILNSHLAGNGLSVYDSSVSHLALKSLAVFGNSDSFRICYQNWNNQKYSEFREDFENVIISLLPYSMNEAVNIAAYPDTKKVTNFFNLLLSKSEKIDENCLSEIAENVLSNTILNMNFLSESTELISDCVRAIKILSDNKWTRASESVLTFFEQAKKFNEHGNLSDVDFALVIYSLGEVAPLDAVTPLIAFLESLNSKVEQHSSVSEEVVLASINTLGAIGDKSAFDALLSVTYYNYPQSVLSAAREALSGLKW